MAQDIVGAVNAILSTIKTRWDTDTTAIVGYVPALVFDTNEADFKVHPSTTEKAWARAVVRHSDASKVTLANAAGNARYRRTGIAWVQIFVPNKDGSSYTIAQRLARVAQMAYEGKRAESGFVVFTKAAIQDQPIEGTWRRYDVKASFYWDEIK